MNYLLSASLIFYLGTLALHIWLSYTGCQGHILDISKAFDKVWHEGLSHKLETYGVKGEVLNLLRNYLHERYQRVVLNGQTFWQLINTGVLQGSVLGPLMFWIYTNDLPDNIQSTCKTFVNDTSLCSHVSDKSTSQHELNKDLQGVSNWASQWKMQLNPDPNKQAQEVYFLKKGNNVSSHPVLFNNTKVVTCSSQKDVGLVLDQQLNFNDHIESKMSKCYKMIDIIERL